MKSSGTTSDEMLEFTNRVSTGAARSTNTKVEGTEVVADNGSAWITWKKAMETHDEETLLAMVEGQGIQIKHK